MSKRRGNRFPLPRFPPQSNSGSRREGANPSLNAKSSRETLFRVTSALAASSIVFFLGAILVVLFVFSWPSIIYNGTGFLNGRTWDIGNLYSSRQTVHAGFTAAAGAHFGILVFLVGTLATAALALLMAAPVSLGVAVFLTRFAPPFARSPLSVLVELLAGVPSVVFGLWGWAVIVPWVARSLAPFLSSHFGWIPFFAGSAGTGMGLLSSGLVLAVMVVPIITAISRDAIANTPPSLIEQGRALGTTEWEVIRDIILPHARAGILGGIVLGLGRALGETMAILMVSGNALNYLPQNIYNPVGTIAATIVSQLDSAMTDSTGMAVYALAEMALVLFVITLLVNMAAPLVMRISGGIMTLGEAREMGDAPFREAGS